MNEQGNTANEQWYSAQVYYYDDEKNDLIVDCVRPLFQDARKYVEKMFFTRHWVHGPHLRLQFFCSHETFVGSIKPLILEKVGSYLQQHPSQTVLDEKKLLPVYELAAQVEEEISPVFPLYPNNSIHFEPYDQRLHVLKSPILANIIEDFYVDTNDIAFDMLEYIRQGHSLLTLSMTLMIAVAHVQGIHLSCGFISYRSHAERFIISCSDADGMRAILTEKYRQQSPQIIKRLHALIHMLDTKNPDEQKAFPFALPWCELMQRYWDRADPIIRSKPVDMLSFIEPEITFFSGIAKQNLQHSAFHSLLVEDKTRGNALYHDLWFATYRLMINLLYLHLSRLNLRAQSRFMLAFLIANSVEDAFHVSAMKFMTSWDPTVPIDTLMKQWDRTLPLDAQVKRG